MKGNDIGVIKGGHDTGFRLEALPAGGIVCDVRRQDLQRNVAAQPEIASSVHLTHAT
jgi:hypothetical protein